MKQKSTHVKWGLAIFLTGGAILLFYDTLFGGKALVLFVRKLMNALQPVVIGALLAYLLAPVIDILEKKLFATKLSQARAQGRLISKPARVVSLLICWVIICFLLYLLSSVLLPELYSSILKLMANLEGYYNTIINWVERLMEKNPAVEKWALSQIDTFYKDINTWIRTQAMTTTQSLMAALSGGVVSTVVFLKDLLVGTIVSIYFLSTKELCAAHTKKMIYALFSSRSVYWILRGARKADSIFSGFVRGKLLDSLIIGVLCFIGCSLLRFPYTPLVSVIVGVTNVIPFFGPFLGAIPSTFLIFLDSPIKAVYFILFVLGLQQLDGNVIGPKILGDSTGLSSLWVIIAILVGGSFFGVPGMFFGVPVCACLYSAAVFLVRYCLQKRNLPLDTLSYTAGKPEIPVPPAEDRSGFPPEKL